MLLLGVSSNISSTQHAARKHGRHTKTHIYLPHTRPLSLCLSLRGLGLAGRGWTRLDHDNHRDDEHSPDGGTSRPPCHLSWAKRSGQLHNSRQNSDCSNSRHSCSSISNMSAASTSSSRPQAVL